MMIHISPAQSTRHWNQLFYYSTSLEYYVGRLSALSEGDPQETNRT